MLIKEISAEGMVSGGWWRKKWGEGRREIDWARLDANCSGRENQHFGKQPRIILCPIQKDFELSPTFHSPFH